MCLSVVKLIRILYDVYMKYKYSIAPTSQFYFCSVPLRLDMTPSCPVGCSYCFASARWGGVNSNTKTLKYADADTLHKKITGQPSDIISKMLENRMPVHIGGMSDPFANRIITELTASHIKILNAVQYPMIISTKAPHRLLQDLRIINIDKTIVQVSMTSILDKLSKSLEPGAQLPSDRIWAIRELVRAGVKVSVRIQPIFPELVSHIANELIPELSKAGVEHIILEFLKLPLERTSREWMYSQNEIFKRTADAYFSERIRVGREWLMPTEKRWEMMQPIIEAAKRSDISYGIADYGLYHFSSTDECCGVSKMMPDTNWHKGNISYSIKKARQYVTFDSIAKYIYYDGSILRYINSSVRKPHAKTMLDYLRIKWNTPGTANAPDVYYCVEKTSELDDEGNIIYFKKQC